MPNLTPHEPPLLDMTSDGQIIDPPTVPVASLLARIAVGAVVIGVVGVALISVLIWALLALIPVAIGAGIAAWAGWQLRGRMSDFNGRR